MYFMDKDKSNTYCTYMRTMIFYSTIRSKKRIRKYHFLFSNRCMYKYIQ